ncbi:hypothetical protein BST44_23135 [Mycobacterium scrofulaceum]|uniref:DM13 domain-containing protein n=1 Tax=Mycobacterium scrofulaceum TaxID=1783 RepID=A0A1X0K7U1_MYCSC|nr:hypothetical protein BST44_23135 [Mycobacterium scrofulaceum]
MALWWLQPWKLLIRTTADDRRPPGARTTRCGEFTGHIHRTSGVARLLTVGDGAKILRLENLHTILGPRLRVWLSDAPVEHARFPWRDLGRCKHIDLGSLRANRGNADYAVPDAADTGAFGAVILWCERFGVSFGAAQLRPATRDPRPNESLRPSRKPLKSRALRRDP